jgi:alkylation response protein AidB-like acyl-CoA dehydrogenase
MSAAGATELVRALLTEPVEARIASTAALKAHAARSTVSPPPAHRAALGGLAAAGVGWAFACGYESALARLDPELARAGAVTALCATEQGGGHPRAIRTALTPAPGGGYVLAGTKSWVTLGADAEVLLVVATTGVDAQGRNRLRVARIPASRSGVRLEPGGATPFAPEIAHARAVFEAVPVADGELLAGDGYAAVLKPFRTIEDVHVLAAVLGWALAVARTSAWERTFLEEGVGLVLLLRALGAADPSSPATHVLLAGALASVKRLLDAAPWATAAAAVRDAWARDRPLLDVASTVRAARREAAWKALGA